MQFEEKEGKYICLKHNQEIKMAVLDDEAPLSDLLLCDTCLDKNSYPYRMVRVNFAKEKIKERLRHEGDPEPLGIQMKKLKNFQQSLIELRNGLLKTIDEINVVLQSWMTDLTNFLKIDLPFDELMELVQSDQELRMKEYQQSYFIKMNRDFNRLLKLEEIDRCYQQLMQLGRQNEEEMPQKQQLLVSKIQPISTLLVNKVKQVEQCNEISFNNSGTVMAAGFEKNIKVWQFNDGKMIELAQLKCLDYFVCCLIFSKKEQWFASGGNRGNIQLWKQGQNNMEWLSSNIEKRQGEILCIIFNQKGDKLISSSSDKTIVVWQVNYERNQIEYSYTLEDKHRNNWIMSLSLNESETALVSCGQDGYILLWVKGANDQWQYKNCATADQYFNRICFINNQEFVIHYQKKGCVEILTTKDYQLKEKQKIKYTDTILESTHGFPIYYNKKKDIILQKADRYIYLIGRDQNGKYMVQAEPIDCKTRYNYGTMTEDGLHIVIWISGEIKEFRIYRVSYA